MNPELQERIYALWDELTEIDATRFNAVTDRLMVSLCELVGAQNAVWIGSVRLSDDRLDDPVKGWRTPVVRWLYPMRPSDDSVKEQLKELDRGVVDAATIAIVANAGRFRANRLRDWVPDDWSESDFYQRYYRGVDDAIFVAFPINADAESWFGVFRAQGQPRFTCEERDTLAYALRGVKWFHRRLMLSHGLLIAGQPLMPAERHVLHLLLARASEKDIGNNLGLTANSVHQYVVSVFRKYGVNNRAALLSLWSGAT